VKLDEMAYPGANSRAVGILYLQSIVSTNKISKNILDGTFIRSYEL
jgi:hypothetical protein